MGANNHLVDLAYEKIKSIGFKYFFLRFNSFRDVCNDSVANDRAFGFYNGQRVHFVPDQSFCWMQVAVFAF